jgi:16S rRNA (cytosine1402-N4)-methyltransferase
MEQQTNNHTPVLIDNILDIINIEFNDSMLSVFDGTLGGGGYTNRFLDKGYSVVACDLDKTVIDLSKEKILNLNFACYQGNFSEIIGDYTDFFDIIVVDLGYSSNQLDFSNRGFSYQKEDEEFDLRYNNDISIPAWKLICEQPVEKLGKIIFNNSGETFANKIANSLKQQDIKYVKDVKNSIESIIPAKFYKKRNAILSRVWQAFRIEINQEFENLNIFLDKSLNALKKNGLLMVVDFHSLEDKIVTKFMRDQAKPIVIDDFGNKVINYKLLTKKPITPSEDEIDDNIRSRSASLRILKKL